MLPKLLQSSALALLPGYSNVIGSAFKIVTRSPESGSTPSLSSHSPSTTTSIDVPSSSPASIFSTKRHSPKYLLPDNVCVSPEKLAVSDVDRPKPLKLLLIIMVRLLVYRRDQDPSNDLTSTTPPFVLTRLASLCRNCVMSSDISSRVESLQSNPHGRTVSGSSSMAVMADSKSSSDTVVLHVASASLAVPELSRAGLSIVSSTSSSNKLSIRE